MKFKVEMTVEFEGFKIPENKSRSMINALQREQVEQEIQKRLADLNSQIQNVYKQRSNG